MKIKKSLIKELKKLYPLVNTKELVEEIVKNKIEAAKAAEEVLMTMDNAQQEEDYYYDGEDE